MIELTTEGEHKLSYNAFLGKLRCYLLCERGRGNRLARHLGTTRQNVSRWFMAGDRQDAPAWAAIAANIWYQRQTEFVFVPAQEAERREAA